MPTGDRREDKFVDIFLSAYDGYSWKDAHVERPEKTQDNAVEAIATRNSDGKTLAIEHTITEPFVGEKRDLAQFWPAFESLRNEKSFRVPDRTTRVFVPVGILDRKKPEDRRTIVDTVGSCLRASIASLPEGWSNLRCEAQNPGKAPVLVDLNCQVLRTPGFTSFLIARQQVAADLDKVVEKALRTKLPKLVKPRLTVVSSCLSGNT
jgi:hypothetical protein